jgi:predicted transcriptional regulator
MAAFTDRKALNHFDRWAVPVADLMTRDPRSIQADATIREAIAFLADKRTTAAPVVNEAGRPIGVLSLTDLISGIRDHGIEEQRLYQLKVSKFMTPFVFFVNSDTPVQNVVAELLDCKVRQMYVADDDGVLVGVLSTADLLRDFHRHAEDQYGDACMTAA